MVPKSSMCFTVPHETASCFTGSVTGGPPQAASPPGRRLYYDHPNQKNQDVKSVKRIFVL